MYYVLDMYGCDTNAPQEPSQYQEEIDGESKHWMPSGCQSMGGSEIANTASEGKRQD